MKVFPSRHTPEYLNVLRAKLSVDTARREAVPIMSPPRVIGDQENDRGIPIDYIGIAATTLFDRGGSGLFTSPNVNALMSTVPPVQRGIASGINTMVGNTGQMLSIAIAFPLVLSRIPEDVMFKVFLFGGGMGDLPDALHAFEQGLHQAFLVSFATPPVPPLASGLRPSHSPRELAAAYAATPSTSTN